MTETLLFSWMEECVIKILDFIWREEDLAQQQSSHWQQWCKKRSQAKNTLTCNVQEARVNLHFTYTDSYPI